jgi:DNA-binding transcriptional MerR regulator
LEYTIQKLGQMAGVSTRTLRYYDEIDLLKPIRISTSGYRIYGSKEVDRLQQILFYRALGVKLDEIKEIINSPGFNTLEALHAHYRRLLERRAEIDELLKNVEKTIAAQEGGSIMTDQEKFAGFKKDMIEKNERKYGQEVREKYGDERVDQSNAKLAAMSQADYDQLTNLSNEVIDTLKAAFATGDPAGELGQKAARLHRQWLSFYWPQYTKEAHVNLVNMYLADQRFSDYYDQHQPGLTKFLQEAVLIYAGKSDSRKIAE